MYGFCCQKRRTGAFLTDKSAPVALSSDSAI